MTDDELEAAMDEGDSQAIAVMTLRDVFAMKSIPFAVKRREHNITFDIGDDWKWDDEDFDTIAGHAYELADAMLRAKVAE